MSGYPSTCLEWIACWCGCWNSVSAYPVFVYRSTFCCFWGYQDTSARGGCTCSWTMLRYNFQLHSKVEVSYSHWPSWRMVESWALELGIEVGELLLFTVNIVPMGWASFVINDLVHLLENISKKCNTKATLCCVLMVHLWIQTRAQRGCCVWNLFLSWDWWFYCEGVGTVGCTMVSIVSVVRSGNGKGVFVGLLGLRTSFINQEWKFSPCHSNYAFTQKVWDLNHLIMGQLCL